MIEYDPNRHWARDLAHLGVSWTLRRLVRAVLAVGVYAAVVTAAVERYDLEGHRLIPGAFSLLGIILSIVLVFRTNTAYDRWWEGRKLWGALVNHSRNLAIQLDSSLPADDRAARATFARLIGNFAVALSGHLRGGVDPKALVGPGPAEVDGPLAGVAQADHMPHRIARDVVVGVHAARRAGVIDGFDVLALKPHTQALLDVAGACERIRKTPIPFSYATFIKLFLVMYALVLPFGLAPEYGWLAVPLVMLVVFALLGLELMAAEIEDPFGLDCNDLPTESIARRIRADVTELLAGGLAPRAPDPQPYAKRS
jgi:ion channel-forming bestrophin family protein